MILLALPLVAGAAEGEFLRVLGSRADIRPVWGEVREYPESRGEFGRDERMPGHKRGPAVGALANAIFDVGPLVLPATPLRLNFDTLLGDAALTRASYIMVEIIGRDGQVRAPFFKERCLLVDLNELGHRLVWNAVPSSAIAGEEVTLRFHVRDARVYALHTEPPPGGPPARSLHDAPAPPGPPRSFTATFAGAELSAWDTTTVALRGVTAEGHFLNLDRARPEFVFEPADTPLQITLDKRDRHLAFATVAGEVTESRRVRVRARATAGGVTFESTATEIVLRPKTAAEKPGTPADAAAAGEVVQLFMQPRDIVGAKGKIVFEANTLLPYAETRGLPTTPRAMAVFNREVAPGRYHVWGSSRTAGGLFRAETTDGIHFGQPEPLHIPTPPEHLMTMTYHEREKRYLAFERGFGPLQWHALISEDGLNFRRAKESPVYIDHDGAHLYYDAATDRYLCMGLTYQRAPLPRMSVDNLGWEQIHGVPMRRVFVVRQSADGVNWTPGGNVTMSEPKSWLPERHLIPPDPQLDPPEMEFYWFLSFRHHDRWVGIALSYAPSPFNVLERSPYDPYPSKHGPHLHTEWWVSDDGVKWSRPYRGTPATRDWRIYFGHAPMRLHERLLFLASNQIYNLPPDSGASPGQNIEIYSLPRDRIASAGSTERAEFASHPFTMPAGGLALNYEHRGTLRVALETADGAPLAGYSAAECAVPVGDEIAGLLRWAGKRGEEHAGKQVRLRFATERARVYALRNSFLKK